MGEGVFEESEGVALGVRDGGTGKGFISLQNPQKRGEKQPVVDLVQGRSVITECPFGRRLSQSRSDLRPP